jgi:hypothetical protein
MSDAAEGGGRWQPRLSRAAAIGWISWISCAAILFIVSSVALLERRSGVCGSEGLDSPREWAFSLLPLGQACLGEGPSVAETILQTLQTAAFLGAATVGAVAVITLAISGVSHRLPQIGRWLIYALIVGVSLAGFVVAREYVADDSLDGPTIVPSLAWQIALAFGLGLAGTGLVGVVRALTARGVTALSSNPSQRDR